MAKATVSAFVTRVATADEIAAIDKATGFGIAPTPAVKARHTVYVVTVKAARDAIIGGLVGLRYEAAAWLAINIAPFNDGDTIVIEASNGDIPAVREACRTAAATRAAAAKSRTMKNPIRSAADTAAIPAESGR